MPERRTVERAKKDLSEGKSPSTAAGEFVREEVKRAKEGRRGAKNPRQAVAIGLSKARRAGVPLEPPEKGRASERTRRSAERAYEAGQQKGEIKAKPAAKRPSSSRGGKPPAAPRKRVRRGARTLH